MTLRPEYSLGHSVYNDFLYATIGVERRGADGDGRDLSVLSALARLQVDPWHEAARLAGLPSDVASHTLAATFARLPDMSWEAVDVATTARRIVALLPTGALPAIPVTSEVAAAGRRAAGSTAAAPAPAPLQKATWASWLVWAVLAVALVGMVMNLLPDKNLEPAAPPTMTLQR